VATGTDWSPSERRGPVHQLSQTLERPGWATIDRLPRLLRFGIEREAGPIGEDPMRSDAEMSDDELGEIRVGRCYGAVDEQAVLTRGANL
jgi:hypothetical protein